MAKWLLTLAKAINAEDTMKQITTKQLDRMILEADKKEKDPMVAQREQAEEQKFEKIKKLQELGEKIHGQINNSFEHLNAFMSLGTKTRDTFEYTRAVAEIGRIQKLTAHMANLITKAHEIAEAEPEMQESPYDSRQMAAMANVQRKDSPQSMGTQEAKQQQPSESLEAIWKRVYPSWNGLKREGMKAGYSIGEISYFAHHLGPNSGMKNMEEGKYGVIMESYGMLKTVDVEAKSAAEALLRVRKTNPAWEVKKILTIKEAAPVKGSKPPLFPDDSKSKEKENPAKPTKLPFKEPPSGSEVPPWAKGAYDEELDAGQQAVLGFRQTPKHYSGQGGNVSASVDEIDGKIYVQVFKKGKEVAREKFDDAHEAKKYIDTLKRAYKITEALAPALKAFVATLEKKYGHDFISKATPQEQAQYMVLAKKAGSGSLADPSRKKNEGDRR